MKIKQTILLVALFVGFASLLIIPDVSAATCGGVQTSFINCDQTGVCTDGSSPFEGSEPKTAVAQAAYKVKYHHDYGKCVNGADPVTDTKQNGIWGIVMLVINILTAGIGIAAVGGIVYGSVLYASSGGSPDQAKKAIEVIRNVVIGILAYALMYAILNFLIPGGFLNQ